MRELWNPFSYCTLSTCKGKRVSEASLEIANIRMMLGMSPYPILDPKQGESGKWKGRRRMCYCVVAQSERIQLQSINWSCRFLIHHLLNHIVLHLGRSSPCAN